LKFACTFTLLVLSIPSSAHHDESHTYFMDQRTRIEGTIVQFLFRNPHSFLHVEVKDPATDQPLRFAVEWPAALVG
jgi:hypothetical protein